MSKELRRELTAATGGGETNLVALGDMDWNELTPTSGVYKELRALNVPHQFAAVLGKFDVMNAHAHRTTQEMVARAMTVRNAQLRLDLYDEENKRKEGNTTAALEGALLGANSNLPNPVNVNQAINAYIGPPAQQQQPQPTPQPPSDPGAYLLETVQIDNSAVATLNAPLIPVAINATGKAIVGDANTTGGVSKAVAGGSVVIAMPGYKLTGLSALTPGAYLYVMTPGPPGVLLPLASLIVGTVARAVLYCISATEARVISSNPYVVTP